MLELIPNLSDEGTLTLLALYFKSALLCRSLRFCTRYSVSILGFVFHLFFFVPF